jgi:hypothetical protein
VGYRFIRGGAESAGTATIVAGMPRAVRGREQGAMTLEL